MVCSEYGYYNSHIRALRQSDLSCSPRPVRLPPLAALDLAGGAAGGFVDEVDGAGHLEAGEMFAGEGLDLLGQFGRAGEAGVQGQHRLDLLAPLLVGHADAAAVLDGGVLDDLV